jgi:hypothetical protein
VCGGVLPHAVGVPTGCSIPGGREDGDPRHRTCDDTCPVACRQGGERQRTRSRTRARRKWT